MPQQRQNHTADLLRRVEDEGKLIEHCCAFLAQLRAIQEHRIQGIERLVVQRDSCCIQCLRTAEVQECLCEGHLRHQLLCLEVH
jgi:hypothetical protein